MSDVSGSRRLSRIGGALFGAVIVLGFCEAAFIRERIVVTGDPQATAAGLKAMTRLWRVAISPTASR